MRVKISALPPYTGPAGPTGDVPISISGTTYRIDPGKLATPGTGGGLVPLDEFEVDGDGSPMGDGDTVYTPDGLVNKAKLAAATGVMVFAGGTLIPNIELGDPSRWVEFVAGDNFFTFQVAGVTHSEHIKVLIY